MKYLHENVNCRHHLKPGQTETRLQCFIRKLKCRCGLGLTGAAIAGGLAGAGIGAASSYAKSKQAKRAAQAQRDWLEQQMQPAQKLEQMQLADYESIYRPQAKLQQQLFKQYAPGIAETGYDVYRGAGALETDVFQPGIRQLYPELFGALYKPYGLPEDLSSELFRTARGRTEEAGKATRQRLTERLAGSGALESGAANALFAKLDIEQLKLIEDQAFKQALAEFDIARSGRQQAIQNLFNLFATPRGADAPAVGPAAVSIGGIGATMPYISDIYTDVPRTGFDFGQMLRQGIGGAQMGAGIYSGDLTFEDILRYGGGF